MLKSGGPCPGPGSLVKHKGRLRYTINREKQDRQGNVLVVVIIVLFVVLMTGLTLAEVATREMQSSVMSWQREQARAAADSGLDYAVWYLSNNNGAWPPPNTDPTVSSVGGPWTGPALASGATFKITVAAGTGRWAINNDIVISSTGTMGSDSVTVNSVAEPVGENVDAWTNAIFAGDGQASGEGFGGNTTVAGSIHIHSDDVTDASTVILSDHGGGGIYNNYADAGGSLASGGFPGTAVPSTEITPGTGSPQDLGAVFRIRYGLMGSGKAIGQNPPTNSGDNGFFAGVYAGTAPGPTGAADITGTTPVTNKIGAYDLGNSQVAFPDLVNPIKVTYNDSGTLNTVTYADYFDFLAGSDPVTGFDDAYSYTPSGGALSITGSSSINIVDPANSKNYIKAASGVMQISGVVWVQGSVSITGVTYSGSGVIVSGGTRSGSGGTAGGETVVNGQNITLGTVGPVGNYNDTPAGSGGFPNNVLAVVSMGDAVLGMSPHDTQIAAVFGEGQVGEPHGGGGAQGQFAGSMVGKSFQLFNNDAIFFVPELPSHLPFGVPGSQSIPVVTGELLLNYQISSWNG
ncbi:MAG TPA: hypothetical protein VFJ58_18365 [Armatimonadota bacterium]|nr:hypothetical protein [Armatimonadota bacterium]